MQIIILPWLVKKADNYTSMIGGQGKSLYFHGWWTKANGYFHGWWTRQIIILQWLMDKGKSLYFNGWWTKTNGYFHGRWTRQIIILQWLMDKGKWLLPWQVDKADHYTSMVDGQRQMVTSMVGRQGRSLYFHSWWTRRISILPLLVEKADHYTDRWLHIGRTQIYGYI